MQNKLDGQTKDIVAQNIEKLKELFPSIVKENKIDFKELELLLGENIERDREQYSFTWNGKTEATKLAQKRSSATLRPCKEESKDWDKTKNIYIEGDNLEVLKLLQAPYCNRIKMIYIDPPYNTGHDFVYKDNFEDNIKNYKEITGQAQKSNAETDGRYHTNWLNMMYPRLKLARNLLSEDGVIFISIDDNEQANLKKLCDDVFGENNFVGIFTINVAPNARDYGHIGKMHENVIFYAKNIFKTKTNLLPEQNKIFKYSDLDGGYNIHPLYNSNEAFTQINRPNLFYPFYLYLDKPLENNFFEIGLKKTENSVEIYPPKSLKNEIQFVWRWGKEKSLSNLNKEIIGYKVSDNEYRIVQKMRHDEKLIRSILFDNKYANRKGTAELEKLFGGKVFSFPKSLNLIYDFCKIGLDKNDTILDFFSGSATTAHAVLKLNAEDEGNRKYICVQLPEQTDENSEAYKAGYKNICEIGKERIRRAGEKIKEENPNTEIDIGFKVFKLDSSNLKKWNNTPTEDIDDVENRIASSIDYLEKDRSELDLVYEIMLKYGLDLTLPITQTKDKKGYIIKSEEYSLMICSKENISMEEIQNFAKEEAEIYLFADRCFNEDNMLINAQELLKAYGKQMRLF